jgi:regulator of sirC expression with transglutaminase-like and TPR domain
MPETTENKKLSALINLLDEPDDAAFIKIREKIFLFGKEAIPALEHAWENAFDIIVQERIGLIIKRIRQDLVGFEFEDWLKLGSSDLLKGYLLVTRAHFPDLDEESLTITIEQMKMDIWLELNENMTALENVKVINHIFFSVHQFDGNKITPNAPENNSLNTLLETRKGSPLSLGMLYMILAQKLKIPIYGVNLPQHFILAYLSESENTDPVESNVLFYINPFNKGAVFTRREIELFIRQLKLKADMTFFEPCTNIDIIKQLIGNLIVSYNQMGLPEKAEDLDNLLKIIEPL